MSQERKPLGPIWNDSAPRLSCVVPKIHSPPSSVRSPPQNGRERRHRRNARQRRDSAPSRTCGRTVLIAYSSLGSDLNVEGPAEAALRGPPA
jgi:hypothetical protein